MTAKVRVVSYEYHCIVTNIDFTLGLAHAANTCRCGSLSASPAISTFLVSRALNTQYDLVPYTAYLTSDTVLDMCFAYSDVCKRALDHFNAVGSQRSVTTCSPHNNYSSWDIHCSFGRFDVSQSAYKALFNSIIRPRTVSLLVSYNATATSLLFDATIHVTWDVCSSFYNICQFYLNKIGCPAADKTVDACGSVDGGYIQGKPGSFIGLCQCATMAVPPAFIVDLIASQLVRQSVYESYANIPSAYDPYELSVLTDPAAQLLTAK